MFCVFAEVTMYKSSNGCKKVGIRYLILQSSEEIYDGSGAPGKIQNSFDFIATTSFE